MRNKKIICDGYGDDGDYFSKLPLAPPTIFLNYLALPTYSGLFMNSI